MKAVTDYGDRFACLNQYMYARGDVVFLFGYACLLCMVFGGNIVKENIRKNIRKKISNILVGKKKVVTLHPQTGTKALPRLRISGAESCCKRKLNASLAQLARARDL